MVIGTAVMLGFGRLNDFVCAQRKYRTTPTIEGVRKCKSTKAMPVGLLLELVVLLLTNNWYWKRLIENGIFIIPTHGYDESVSQSLVWYVR